MLTLTAFKQAIHSAKHFTSWHGLFGLIVRLLPLQRYPRLR